MNEPVRIRSLLLRRAPGLPQGLPEPIRPDPGLTIIHGPNGSGKTTTSRAAQALLWPGESRFEGFWVRGELEYGQAPWLVELGPGVLSVQQAGQDQKHPAGSGSALGDRYNLGLHQLIQADDQAFAEAVLRESSGGYDLKDALKNLGFEERLPRKAGNVYKAYEAALKKLDRARSQQQDLLGQEELLERLQARSMEIRKDQAELERLQNQVKLILAREALKKAEADLASFPEAVSLLTGLETDRLETLKTRIETETEDLAQETKRLEAARKALESLGLPDQGIAPRVLESLRLRTEELEDRERERQRLGREAAGVRAEAEEERRMIGAPVDEERLDALDLDGVTDLAGLARKAGKVRAERQAKEALADWLGRDESRFDSDSLRQGLSLLLQWLLETDEKSSPNQGLKRFLLLLAGALVGSGAILGWKQHWGFFGLILAGVVLWLWLALPRAGARLRTEIQNRFLGLGLAGPESWTLSEVKRTAQGLWKALGREILIEEKEIRWSGLKREREKLARDEFELTQTREDVTARLGMAPDMDETALFFLVEGLRRLQEARARLAQTRARLADAEASVRENLSALSASLAAYGYADLGDLAAIKAAFSDLGQRANEHQRIVQDMGHAEQRIGEARDRIASLETERLALFQKLGLNPDQEAILHRWVGMLPAFASARENMLRAEQQHKLAAQALGPEDDLDPGPLLELEQRIRECRASAADQEAVLKEIGGLRTRLDQARESHDLEEALTGLENSKELLREERDQAEKDALGALIGDYLEQRNKAENLPAVFTRADRFLGLFTRGGYTLDFDPRGPEFRALDTATGQGRSLDQLSSGTRVQLLMAVRMAFVEEQEQGPGLPLFLDEALANSDPERTQAILEAVCGILETGRQVFYFTARPAEVELWRGLLQERGWSSLAVLDLEELKDQGQAQKRPLKSLPAPARPRPPQPGDLDREAYGRLLQVPEFAPGEDDMGSTHVWHFFQEPGLIHRLLLAGYKRWGPLRTMLLSGALPFLSKDSPEAKRALAVAAVLEEAARAWRVGRGRPVTRQDLVDGGVSPVFIDRVDELSQELGQDARALLAALSNGQVKRFKKETVAALEEHLEEAGCLDQRALLNRDQVLERAMLAASQELKAGYLTPPEIKALIQRLDLSA